MPPRIHAPDFDSSSTVVRLSPEESAHLTRVLRLGPGDPVLVFNGSGVQHRALIADVEKAGVTLALAEVVPAAPELPVSVVVAQALLKGDQMDEVIRDATMAGAGAVVPIETQRSVVPKKAAHEAMDRWHRVAVASAKQCGRAVVPRVEPPLPLAALLQSTREACRLCLLEPDAIPPGTAAHALPERPTREAVLLIGPEGGWTPAEVEAMLASGFRPLSLGRRTLRAERAALAALSVLAWEWER